MTEQTTEQRERAQRENQRLFAGIGVIGVMAILLGLVVLLVTNWDNVPDLVKLGGGISVLWAALYGAMRTGKLSERWPRDLFLLLHSGALFLMTWLVAMVYGLSAHPWRSFAFCALFSLPAALLGELSILGDALIFFALCAVFLFIGETSWLHPLLEGYGTFFFMGMIALLLFRWARRLGAEDKQRGIVIALRRWGWFSAITSLVGSLLAFGEFGLSMTRSDVGMMIAYIGAAVLWGPSAFGVLQGREGRLFWRGILLLPIATVSVSLLGTKLRLLLGFALTVWFLVTLVEVCITNRNRSGARLAMALLVGRVLVFYGEVLGNNLLSGWWLIFVGLSLGVGAYAWSRWSPDYSSIPAEPPQVVHSAPGDQRSFLLLIGIIESLIFFFLIAREELRAVPEKAHGRQVSDLCAPTQTPPSELGSFTVDF